MLEALVLPAGSLWRREMVRFFRQRSRVIGSLGTPLLFWLLFSGGLGPSFKPPSGVDAFAYFFPGALTLILLFTSIFANISVIEDRHEGFLQGVLVAPVGRAAILLGKVLGAATIATLQALVLLALATVGGLGIPVANVVPILAAVLTLAVALSALGFAFAWKLDSVQGFHGVMNLLLMPMWVLSGAMFPTTGLPSALRILVAVNPMTYGGTWLQHELGVAGTDVPSAATCALVTAAFAAVALLAAGWVAKARRRG